MHWQARDEEPEWPMIPMASAVEKMGVERRPIGVSAPNSPSAEAIRKLWAGIESKLCEQIDDAAERAKQA